MDDTFQKVEKHLLKVSIARHQAIPITSETELYRDLRMYGDDPSFDMVLWAKSEFDVEPNLRVADYGPREMAAPSFRRLLAKLVAGKSVNTKARKCAIVAAIEAKRWPN